MKKVNDLIRIVQPVDDQHPFVIVYKKAGLPSAPLTKEDRENAFSYAAGVFPILYEIVGRKVIEHGLIHRIDNDASGLLLIAATQQAYDYFLVAQKKGNFIKEYRAECDIYCRDSHITDGFPPLGERLHQQVETYLDSLNEEPDSKLTVQLASKFRVFGPGRREVRPVSALSGNSATDKAFEKDYVTTIRLLGRAEQNKHRIMVSCTISSGFRHQVRSHLSWLGFPIVGDMLYNPFSSRENTYLHFEATSLQFPDPKSGKMLKYISDKKQYQTT